MDYEIVETRGFKWIRLSELLGIFDWKFESIDGEKLVIYQEKICKLKKSVVF